MRPLASKQEKCFLDRIPSRYFPPRGSDGEDWWFWSGYSQVSLEWLSPVWTAVWFYTMDGQCLSPTRDTSIRFYLTRFAFPEQIFIIYKWMWNRCVVVWQCDLFSFRHQRWSGCRTRIPTASSQMCTRLASCCTSSCQEHFHIPTSTTETRWEGSKCLTCCSNMNNIYSVLLKLFWLEIPIQLFTWPPNKVIQSDVFAWGINLMVRSFVRFLFREGRGMYCILVFLLDILKHRKTNKVVTALRPVLSLLEATSAP